MVSISTDFAADMSQKAWAKGSGSEEMLEPLKMLPNIHPAFQSEQHLSRTAEDTRCF